ncbi:hypothetical protein QO034_19765 [Sedimentitalea sp. JM2-8]|uniref:Uncharacterized protein n=1 Tax=Sedimentitalea xiamensis TaxID=3050037 RepID=A0ABT7FJM8_9RHOB|nr:hypothetical protein [Sedimentitalea xiamensis]MDK3075321.1 hypothetical protein [Sedimentitalea xiamensis]
MRKSLMAIGLALWLAQPAAAEPAYDLIFKQGTLSDLGMQSVLVYDRQVEIAADLDRARRSTGTVDMAFATDDMAQLTFRQDDKHQSLGRFPASVGNPIVMYFVETVLRDVAHEAGGSPFYIRTKIKDSLVQPAEIESVTLRFGDRDVAGQKITLHPFRDDENRDRMKGYGDLSLSFTVSEDYPGWYGALVADVPGETETQPIYSNRLILTGEEVRQ